MRLLMTGGELQSASQSTQGKYDQWNILPSQDEPVPKVELAISKATEVPMVE